MLEFLNLLKNGIPLDFKLAESFLKTLESLRILDVLEVRKNCYVLKKHFCIGEIELAKEGYGFVIPLPKGKARDWLVEKNLLKGAQKGDIVLAKMLNKQRNTRVYAKVIQILETKENSVLCYLEKYKLDCMAISIPNEIPYKIKASQKSLKTLPPNTILKLNPKNGEILEILGALSDPRIDESIALHLYNRQESFSLQAELQADSFKAVHLKDFKERVNCTYLPFCAIDPVGAKDHDDAIFYDDENSTLYVAIADVSYYVSKDSALDIEAKARGFSVYFPHKSIPMLPRVLSENLCSLSEGKLRLAMVWKIRLHKRTKVVLNSELFEAVIKVRQKLTYEAVDTFLNTKQSKEIKPALKPMLFSLNALAQKLRQKRLKNGFDFLGDDSVMELDKNLELKDLKIESQTQSHQLVEECMLLANIQSAILQSKQSTQGDERLKLGIYRVHDAPKQASIQDLFAEFRLLGIYQKNTIPKNTKEFHKAILEIQTLVKDSNMAAEVDKLIIKSMQQAFYASHNIGHFGLGFEMYSHFTSPIRRYSDLLLHRILKAKIKLNQESLESLPQICENLSQKEREVAKIEMDFKDRKFARYLYKKIGQAYLGVVINDKRPELIVLTTPPLQGARVVCLKGTGVKYQKVCVQIVDVNLATTKVYGRILESFNEGFGIQNAQISKYLFTKTHQKLQNVREKAKLNAKKMGKNIKKRSKSSSFKPRHKRKGK
ncbi:RNB domain-containing ribonuclease [Helicobacter sp. MIT 11-5569]|uniref:RNB domain-containing ribonuclease n=1 Tax=Helicobacter sp. MIT 11-5569 TaxID=1548151 RepID=UPI00051FA551|nr:ribonuclease R family protein [Helicobacter sp. MIT 11-5569]TLD82849.1 RNB domain-containing ribonuclease [Helicobacter sp. MIT 11-5569]